MIIVEGMDNTGKTTLVEKLAEYFGLEIVKSPGPQRYRELFDNADLYIHTAEKLKEKDELKEYPFIHDRFPIFSDIVYSILRSINPFEELEEGKWLRERLYKVKPAIIYCRPDTETILSFKDGREQMEGVKPKGKELLSRYDHIIFQWNKQMGASNRTMPYSFEEHSPKEVIQFLEEMGYEKNG